METWPIRSGWILLATALSEVDLTVAIIPQDIQSSSQRRVDFGYNPGIIIGITDANGRAYFGYGQTSYDNGAPEISLTGDTDTDDIIEGSKDLKNGSPFTTTTIWAAAISADFEPQVIECVADSRVSPPLILLCHFQYDLDYFLFR